MSSTVRVLVSLVVGLIGGILVSVLDNAVLDRIPAIVEPIGTLWVNAIRMTVVPLIVPLLIMAIAGGQQDGLVATLGAKTVGLFVAFVAAACIYTALTAPVLLSLLSIDPDSAAALRAMTGSDASRVTELPPFREEDCHRFDWLVSLIPVNPIEAAADGAILPLIIFTALFAAAITRIAEPGRGTILRFFMAIKDAMFTLVEWIMFVAPIGVFALVFPLAAGMGASAAGAIAFYLVVTGTLITIAVGLLYPLVAIIGRVPATDFAKACAPTQAVGFSTRSSLAALPTQLTATEKLELSPSVAGVVLPIAVSLFKFASAIGRTVGAYFVARLYGIELGPSELLLIAAAVGLLSFYSPGIPSGGLMIMAPVFVSVGLPVQGLGILIALDLVVDMFITMGNVTANVAVVTILTRSDRASLPSAQA